MKLSKPQKLIYDLEKYAGGRCTLVCGSLLIKGRREETEIQDAANELVRLNDALRIHIKEDADGTSQYIVPFHKHNIEIMYFKDKNELDSWAKELVNTPLDFYGELCEIRGIVLPDSFGLLVKLHHIICDAWTISLMGNQFISFLDDNTPMANSYVKYIDTESQYLSSEQYKKDKEFFIQQLRKSSEIVYLGNNRNRTFSCDNKTFLIEKSEAKNIYDFVSTNRISVFVLFAAAVAVYIKRTHMCAESFYVGTEILNRLNNVDKNTAGMFVNTVPMLMNIDDSASFEQILLNVQKSALSLMRHQRFNYGDLLTEARKEFDINDQLFDVTISYQNAKIMGHGIETTWYHTTEQTESLAIHVDDRENQGYLRISYEYKVDDFREEDIDVFHERLCAILFDGINHIGKKLSELDLFLSGEKERINSFNSTEAYYPRNKCVHELFQEYTRVDPSSIALVFEEKQYTYKNIDDMSNSLAHHLASNNITVNDTVPMIVRRSEYLIVAMLGILKAGGAYVPLDFSSPMERIRTIVDELKPKTIIVFDKDLSALNLGIKIIDLDEIDFFSNTEPLENKATSDDLCYVIYTSGSTGTPKGVGILHRNVVNYCYDSITNKMVRRLKDECACSSIVSINNACFDAFLDESFLPLLNGFTVYLANQEQTVNCKQFLRLVNDNRIDITSTTPTKLKILTRGNECHLKHIILGGERLTPNDVKYFKTISRGVIYNTYGPTETTCGCTYSEIDYHDDICEDDITIGKPISNTQIYIVDGYMNILPIGVCGELCIAGDGVGTGYIGHPELTADRFIDNPFGQGKLYRSGDLAYWREDGNIAYVGRNDFQVKIRGLRIELGEIENTISSIEGISQSVVVVRKNKEDEPIICAFYTGLQFDPKDIRTRISVRMPKYMIPHVIVHLDMMPLTISGKINRNALPEVDDCEILNISEYVEPESAQEKTLCILLEEVLKRQKVGVTDDFFDLGGDSLKAIEFATSARGEGIFFELQALYDHPTVRSLCDSIKHKERRLCLLDGHEYAKYNKLLQGNDLRSLSCVKTRDIGNILITGCTGYLGIHILADFLENDHGDAYCIVRGKNKSESIRRLSDLLVFYFGNKFEGNKRIHVVCSDILDNKFNLSDREYTEIVDNVDLVINCAANVKHYGTYDYFYETNVNTVKRLCDFAKEACARLIHISTLSISGDSFASDFAADKSCKCLHFNENDLFIGQSLNNVYTRSKFDAEVVVLHAISQGLQANIMRVGNLTNRLVDGVFQKNYETNAFAKRIIAILRLGCVPHKLAETLEIDFTPVDEAASAIMNIARHFSDKKFTFHINNKSSINLKKLVEYFSILGYNIDIIEDECFESVLKKSYDNKNDDSIAKAFFEDIDLNGNLHFERNVVVENKMTIYYLRRLGFEWSNLGVDYVKKCLDYFKKINCIK